MRERIFLSPPHLDGNEREYVAEAFASNYVAPCGPMVERFEKDFAKTVSMAHTCALSSATSAFDLLCDVLQIGNGDVVYCSDLTFIASIGPAVRRGATPVFIDSDETTWTMDPSALGQALADAKDRGRLPKAVVAVDLYGQCCDYARIGPLCESYGVPLIADAAEALGASYRAEDGTWRAAGNAGLAGIWSFNGNKIITTSGGGMVGSATPELIERVRFLSQQAKEPVPWYEHKVVGTNARMSNIVAAIGVGQLERLPAKVARRREIGRLYRSVLSEVPGIRFLEDTPASRGNHWLTVLRLPARLRPEDVRLALERENIESRPVWKPMHMQPVFKDAKTYGTGASERLFADGLCLPSGTSMSDDDVLRVAEIVKVLCPA